MERTDIKPQSFAAADFPYRPLGQPNAESIEAMDQLDRGEGITVSTIAELMSDLDAED
ncbi:MAG: hypothetical protein QM523_03090 [Candidatus Pacebacteria bacterium]|nr:hypothetical protein [Candidatus Paceibacterota bacterium]